MILDNIKLLELYKLDLKYYKKNKKEFNQIKRLIELRKSRTFDIFKKIENKSLYILIEYVKLKIRSLKMNKRKKI